MLAPWLRCSVCCHGTQWEDCPQQWTQGNGGKVGALNCHSIDKAWTIEWCVSTVQFYLKCCISAFYVTFWFDVNMCLKRPCKIFCNTHQSTSVLMVLVACWGGIWHHFLVFCLAVVRIWYLLNAERKSSWCLFCGKIFWCGSLKLRNQTSWKTENLSNLLFQFCLYSNRESHKKIKLLFYEKEEQFDWKDTFENYD